MSENKKNIPEAEISDELLDAVTGGAKLPEVKIPTPTKKESKQSSATPGSSEWWAEHSAYMASIAPTIPPSSEENP